MKDSSYNNTLWCEIGHVYSRHGTDCSLSYLSTWQRRQGSTHKWSTCCVWSHQTHTSPSRWQWREATWSGVKQRDNVRGPAKPSEASPSVLSFARCRQATTRPLFPRHTSQPMTDLANRYKHVENISELFLFLFIVNLLTTRKKMFHVFTLVLLLRLSRGK